MEERNWSLTHRRSPTGNSLSSEGNSLESPKCNCNVTHTPRGTERDASTQAILLWVKAGGKMKKKSIKMHSSAPRFSTHFLGFSKFVRNFWTKISEAGMLSRSLALVLSRSPSLSLRGCLCVCERGGGIFQFSYLCNFAQSSCVFLVQCVRFWHPSISRPNSTKGDKPEITEKLPKLFPFSPDFRPITADQVHHPKRR